MRVPLASVRGVLIIGLIWLALAAIVALMLWPLRPSSIGGWILFVVFAPPLYVVASGIADLAWSTRFGRYISEHPSRFVRISLGVIVLGLFLAIGSAAWLAVRHWTGI